MSDWKHDYEKMLLDASGYSGNRDKSQKIISASSLGNNLLELYLDYQHGKTADTKFEASNFGSIYQLGVDLACKDNSQYISAQRFSYELQNGWKVSGEIDQIDTVNKVIIDNKVTTMTAKKKIISEGKDNGYALQLAVYKFLLFKNWGEHYTGSLAVVDKTSSYFKPQTGDMITYMDIDTYNYEEIEQKLLDKSNELQSYIDLNEEPPICENRFPYKSKGTTKSMKCIYYCNYTKHCKYAPNEFSQVNDAIGNIMDSYSAANSGINPFDVGKYNF